MSKILSSVLEKISENNNEYRMILRDLNASIDEMSTALVGDLVTASGYTIDFSNTITVAKEKLINPISRIVESYVIKDLRSVETVNEQFIEKINDKLENNNITTEEDRIKFNKNLNSLLNDKYLEIVKIKRVNFFNENNQNVNLEEAINDFVSNVSSSKENITPIISDYKNKLYSAIEKSLKDVSDLYLSNFVNEVSASLEGTIDVEQTKEEETAFIPKINPIPEPELEEAPEEGFNIPEVPEEKLQETQEPESFDIPEVPSSDDNNFEIPQVPTEEFEIPDAPSDSDEEKIIIPEVPASSVDEKEEDVLPMQAVNNVPVEVKDEAKELIVPSKHNYDVDEILKIAKSPVVSDENIKDEKENKYVRVKRIKQEKENETEVTEYNEREIVEEMISRLTRRLKAIDERKEKYEAEKAKVEEDENFVNDLIISSDEKNRELNEFEIELNNKEKELDKKQKELDKRINDVMPFANAVLKQEESN